MDIPIIDISSLNTTTRQWLDSRPPKVREKFLAFPPGTYLMKPGAPYSITAPGCKVALIGHNDSGDAIVTMLEATTDSLEYVSRLERQHNKSNVDLSRVKTYVATEWLELVSLDRDLEHARIKPN